MVPANALAQPVATARAPEVNENILAQLAEAGFGGIQVGYGSFDMLTMDNKGEISSSGQLPIGSWLTCRIMSSKAKWAVKQDLTKPKVLYTYGPTGLGPNDQPTEEQLMDSLTSDGSLIRPIVDSWRQQGIGVNVASYVELTVTLEASERDPAGSIVGGQTCIAQVSPSSVNRYGGYATLLAFGGQLPNQVTTKIYAGEMITKVDNPFCPWMFMKL